MPILITASPCIGTCKSNKRGICKGCGRTDREIERWKSLSAENRHDINMRLLATQGKQVRQKLLKPIARTAEQDGLA
ncbi:DUF1289 domain-containing protein [Caldimonas brevitalea]|uniref:DUF1289 domain-containing protein n=1 Tax=Caldimonas brevitalea TaxID=413882 RepID=A0A0G3BLD4_9BURK|nr:DUF1289 domain-containing protein [Caldimonas brevitalea]AKJ27330.1 hypothetical protein AAW51_0639 [Caldimonas brevitalea]